MNISRIIFTINKQISINMTIFSNTYNQRLYMKYLILPKILVVLSLFFSSASFAYSCSTTNNSIVPSLSTGIANASANVSALQNTLQTADSYGKVLCIPNGTYYTQRN